NAVVGGHHEDDDVGRLGAAGAHRRERLVPWRVQERNLAVPSLDLVGADVLRDPPNSFSATLDLRIASRSEVLPWSTWPMTVTTGGRSLSWAGSRSSSSRTSPSTDRISRSTLNLSATSFAAVGSSSSLTVAMTPSSR